MKNLIIILLCSFIWLQGSAQDNALNSTSETQHIFKKREKKMAEKEPSSGTDLESIISPWDLKDVIVNILGCYNESLRKDCPIPVDSFIFNPDSSYGLEALRTFKSDFEEGKLLQISLFRLTMLPLDYHIEFVGFFLIDKANSERTRMCFVETEEGVFIKTGKDDPGSIEDKDLPQKAVNFMLKQLKERH